MTWRQMTVCKILLLIARIVANDPALHEEIRNLSNHITTWGGKADAA